MTKIPIKQYDHDNMVRATTLTLLANMMATSDRNEDPDYVVRKAERMAIAYLDKFYEVEPNE